MGQYQITVIQPGDYNHSSCFREVALSLQSGLRACGHSASTHFNTFDPRAVNIVLGAHLLTPQQARSIPTGSIIYNLEQIGGAKLPPGFYELASRYQIWDYSPLNIEQWRKINCVSSPVLAEIGYAPELRSIKRREEEDIDVLFYGSVNDRRAQVLRKLESAGLNVCSVFGVYGDARDELIARSRIVLNVHFYETQVFEIVRVSYLLANSKAVVTEHSPDLGSLRNAVAAFPYDSLAEGCLSLLRDEARRHALESKAFELFSQLSEAHILSEAIAASAPLSGPAPAKVLNMGSGKDWREDCFNVDVNDYWEPDAVIDFSKPLGFGRSIETRRFGAMQLEEGMFDEIISNDVLEHIPSLTAAMTSCLRLLKTGGLFRIQVPYDLSYGAWQDPTHLRAFNERSWLYYTDWFWYLEWEEARFDLLEVQFVLSPIGEKLKPQFALEDLIRQPRAVDHMRVTLRKRLLTEPEKQLVARYLKRPDRGARAEKPVCGSNRSPRRTQHARGGLEGRTRRGSVAPAQKQPKAEPTVLA